VQPVPGLDLQFTNDQRLTNAVTSPSAGARPEKRPERLRKVPGHDANRPPASKAMARDTISLGSHECLEVDKCVLTLDHVSRAVEDDPEVVRVE
jgi:hypothetical protein